MSGRRGGVLSKAVVGGVLLAAVGLVVVVAILPAPEKQVPDKKPQPINVGVLPIVPIPERPDTFLLPGTVEPNTVVRVAAEVPGRVEAIDLVEGRPCRAGDVLVRLNTDLLQAELDRAKAAMKFNQREVVRLADLRNSGVATDTEYDQAEAQAAASKAAFDAARAQLERATIAAPTGGALNRLPVETGEYVTPGTIGRDTRRTSTVWSGKRRSSFPLPRGSAR